MKLVIQNRVVRLMAPSNTVDSYSYLKLFELYDIYNYFKFIRMYKIIKAGDEYFGDITNNLLHSTA